MDYDALFVAAGVVFSSCIFAMLVLWWSWFTVEKIDNAALSLIVFFAPIIPILIGLTYFILESSL